ncbi:kinase-like protein [Calocera cornea HHB12733]|uniref:Kinase-like protein n=1 Tax=Calocera cornea HHB12733 TaxID=1353952 RepID=A0A165CHC3_9BASI|nr:kinase-like protein [Calocera cornea HHB12733]
MAPEMLNPHKYGMTTITSLMPPLDVYMLANVFYEIYAGQRPFFNTRNLFLLATRIDAGDRPPHPGKQAEERGLNDFVWSILLRCWNADPTRRPLSLELLSQMTALPEDTDSEISEVFTSQNAFSHLTNELGSAVDLTGDIQDITSIAIDGGARGDIWIGQYKGHKVAIKTRRVLSYQPSHHIIHRLARELDIWKDLKHPNILPLLGVCAHGPYGFALVSPWMERGHIRSYLRLDPMVRRPSLVLGIARGLQYLHETGIVHGDLRGSNVLVDPSGEVRLADFGFSYAFRGFSGSQDAEVSPINLNPRWLAPERLYPEKYGLTTARAMTTASDIYSCGMVIYEIYTGQDPFYQITAAFRIASMVQEGTRPKRPEQALCPSSDLQDAMWEIAEACWSRDPWSRPTALEVVDRVRAVITNEILH